MRPIRVEVDDPAGEISTIRLVHHTPDCVVLHVDMSKKRQEVTASSGACFEFDRAQVRVIGLPFRRNFCLSAKTNRYTCFVTFISYRAIGRGLSDKNTLWWSEKETP